MVSTAPPGPVQQPQLVPNPFQQIGLDAPLSDILFMGGAKGNGKTKCIEFLVVRDAKILGKDYHCLITRSSFQALQELQTNLFRILTQTYPGTVWNAGENIFRIGGKSAPYGTIELAYTASSPLEQIRALARLQGRSKTCIIHDECGVQASPDFYDQLQGCLRAPVGIPTRTIFFANPGGPGHVWAKERFAIPAGMPGSMQPKRFWSEHYERHCIFVTADASVNPHLDWQQYKRQVEIMAGGDPAMYAALIEGRWDLDLGGAFFASCWSPTRCRHFIRPGDITLRQHSPAPFVAMDWGYSAPSVAYLVVPNPPGVDCPQGTLLLADELYIAGIGPSGRRDWLKGACLPSSEQAMILREWLQRWGVGPNDIRVLIDDQVFAHQGSERGSVAADFRSAGVVLQRAEKAKTPVSVGLNMLRNRMHAAGRDRRQPWLLWAPSCEGWEATVPSLVAHPRDPECLADGQPDHAADAARYAVTWFEARWKSGSGFRLW